MATKKPPPAHAADREALRPPRASASAAAVSAVAWAGAVAGPPPTLRTQTTDGRLANRAAAAVVARLDGTCTERTLRRFSGKGVYVFREYCGRA